MVIFRKSASRLLFLLCVAALLVYITMHFAHFSIHHSIGQSEGAPTIPDIESSAGDQPALPLSSSSSAPCQPLRLALSQTSVSKSGIPNLLHLIYADTRTPEQYLQLIRKCFKLNGANMHFVLWTNDDARAFLNDHESARKRSLFDGLHFELERSDAARYLILHHFGGMYMDMDEECVRPLWPLLNNHSCLLDQEDPQQSQLWHNRQFIAMNSAMACRPRHPFFIYLLEQLATYVKKPGNVIDRTGPLFLTDVFQKYLQVTQLTPETNVTLMPSSAFTPLKDPGTSVLNDFRQRCKETERLSKNPIMRQGCEAWAQEGYGLGNVKEKLRDAYLVHKFMHLGHLGGRQSVRHFVDVCSKENPHVTFYRYTLT